MNPTMMMAKILTMNTSVGPISTLADSAIPDQVDGGDQGKPGHRRVSK